MKINSDETEIIGHWIFDGGKMVTDERSKRIDWLRNNYLIQISTDESGWFRLFQDPADKRYWVLIFEHGELQGGGPPSLKVLSISEAKSKYKF